MRINAGAPKIIDPINFPLEKSDFNSRKYKEIAAELKAGKASVLETIEGNDLIQLGQKYFLLDHQNQRILYYMAYLIRKIRGFREIYQVIVWREAGMVLPKGFAQHVMFDYLLPQADLITSDRMQTNRGAGLWQDFVTTALSKKYFVWAMDLNVNKIQKITTRQEMAELSPKVWTNREYSEGVLLGVSKEDLFSKTEALSAYPNLKKVLEQA